MKNITRIIIALLILAMTLPMALACAETAPQGEETTAPAITEAPSATDAPVETTAEETTEEITEVITDELTELTTLPPDNPDDTIYVEVGGGCFSFVSFSVLAIVLAGIAALRKKEEK